MKKLYRIFQYYRKMVLFLRLSAISVFGIFVVSILLLQLPPVQNYLAEKVVHRIANRLQTEIDFDHVRLQGMHRIELYDAYVLDQQNDTLLYGHEIKVNFNLWQLFKRNLRINDIQLNAPRIKAYRLTEKEGFNYDFLTQSSSSDTSSTASSWSVELNQITVKNTLIDYRDMPGKNIISIKLPIINAGFSETNIETQKLHLSKFLIEKGSYQIVRLESANNAVDSGISQSTEKSPVVLNSGAWEIQIDTFQLNKNHISFQQSPVATSLKKYIDFSNLDISELQATLQNFHWLGDSIDANIRQIDCKEKSGFDLNSLSGYLHMNASNAIFNSFHVLTPQSEIKEYLALTFHSLSDFNDILNRVQFEGNFADATIAMKDIKYFAPSIRNDEQQVLNFSGEVKGKIADLRGKNMEITYNNATQFSGGIEMIGLPDINETFINIEAQQFRSNYSEIGELLPDIHLPASVKKLGQVKFHGQFTGFIRDFVAYGTMQTALGILKSDINMKFDHAGIPKYSGNLASNQFQLGKWLDRDYVGNIAFNSKLDGKGFDFSRMEMNLDGNISLLELNDYAYHHVKLKGSMKKRFFSGLLDVNDRRANFDFTGTIDLAQTDPIFNFKSNVTFADLYDLNISDQPLQIKTNATLAFKGLNPDRMNGQIQFTNAFVSSAEGHYNIDTILINSSVDSFGNKFIVQSDIIDLNLQGNYTLSQIPNQVIAVLNSYYYPNSNLPMAVDTDKSQFDFTLIVKKNYPAFSLLYNGLQGLGGSYIYGNFDSKNRKIKVDGIVPQIRFGSSEKVENANFLVRTKNDTLKIGASFRNFEINEQNSLGESRLKASIFGNEAHFILESANDNIINKVLLSGDANRKGDTIDIRLNGSKIDLAEEVWDINSDNIFRFYDNGMQLAHFQLKNSDQTIELSTNGSQANYTALQLEIHDLQCQTLSHLADYKEYQINGNIDGTVRLLNVFGKSFRIIQDLHIDDFSIDNQDIGLLELQGGYIPYIKQINIATKLIQADTLLNLNGVVTLDKSREQINLNGHLNELPAAVLNPILSGVISDMQGSFSGNFKVGGKPDNLDLTGKIGYKEASVHFDYLNTNYTLDSLQLSLQNHSIIFEPSILYDINKVPATLSGELLLQSLNELAFKYFVLKTDEDFELMDLSPEENSDFYGQVFGTALVDINGPVNNLKVYVDASTGNNSRLFIPVTYSSEYDDYDFIKFKEPALDSLSEEDYYGHLNNLHLNMDLDVNPKAEVQLIFDLQAGDIIKSRGDGNIKLDINTLGDFNMYGNYTIKNGSYLFTLKNIINKEFLIEDGGTLTWSGDPYEALLNINAIYKIKASGYDLFSTEAEQLSDAEIKKLKQPTPLDVYLKMRGNLSAPDISFDIKQSTEDSYLVSNRFNQKLQEIRADDNELSKQVLGLIVFNKFIPSDITTSASTGANWKSTGVNTMTEFLSSQLSMYFSDMLSKYDMEVDLNYKNYELGDFSNDNNSLSRNELNLELSKKLGRFSVNVGGNFDFGNTNSSVTTANNLAGDFEVEYSISEDGKFRVKGFRKSDYDIFENANKSKTGLGLFFRKDFDTTSEFFRLNNEKKTASEDGEKPVNGEISNFPE